MGTKMLIKIGWKKLGWYYSEGAYKSGDKFFITISNDSKQKRLIQGSIILASLTFSDSDFYSIHLYRCERFSDHLIDMKESPQVVNFVVKRKRYNLSTPYLPPRPVCLDHFKENTREHLSPREERRENLMNIHDEFAFRCSLPSRMLFHIIFMLSVSAPGGNIHLIGPWLNLKNGGSDSRPVFISSRLPNNPLFELSWLQIIQLFCVFISPQLQSSGYLVEIIIPRYLGLVCKISRYLAKYYAILQNIRYLSGVTSPAQRLALCDERWAKYLEVESRADEDIPIGLVCGWSKSCWGCADELFSQLQCSSCLNENSLVL